jgi:hypothetical protein
MQRETAQSNRKVDDDYGVVEAHPIFEPAGLTFFIDFWLSCTFSSLSLIFMLVFCTYEGKLPYRNSTQMHSGALSGVDCCLRSNILVQSSIIL